MKTIKIIDLLNKIANGEKTPEKIKYQNKIFIHNGFGNNNYWCEEKNVIFEESFILEDLNDEVEIIEEENREKKIKIIDVESPISVVKCAEKINELIDTINELKQDN